MALIRLIIENLQGGNFVFVAAYPFGKILGQGFIIFRPACVDDFINLGVNFLLVLFADIVQCGDEFHGKRTCGGFDALFLYL